MEGKLGTDRDLGEVDLFLPLAQSDRTLLFSDIRARADDEGSHEGNFGLGLRHMHASGWNFGVYGYYDRRRTDLDNYFEQATLGNVHEGREAILDLCMHGNLQVVYLGNADHVHILVSPK